MQQLARKFEADLTFDFGTVIGKVENPHPTPLSVMQELVVDGCPPSALMRQIGRVEEGRISGSS